MKLTNKQLVIIGSFVELYKYEKAISYENQSAREGKVFDKSSNLFDETSRSRSTEHAKKMIRRIMFSNINQWKDERGIFYRPRFVTLTFAENEKDLQKANYEFTLFIKRLNYFLFKNTKKLHYLAVVEFQKRGSIHYHVVFFDMPFIKQVYDEISRIWKHGFIHFRTIRTTTRAVAYITKYITKIDDTRLYGEKMFFTSRDLKRPRILNLEQKVNELSNLLLFLEPDFSSTFDTINTGKTNYKLFNLEKYPNALKLINESVESFNKKLLNYSLI